ncbi:hypothetical protein [Acetivibrio clariflavus]|uniref:hypothetical protein n=1 Tax=Acetivibrio clariflavus TaxID=288965 RepID=UPI00047F54E3|nr:hypothetical protein [Acetivibrio clariflavus]
MSSLFMADYKERAPFKRRNYEILRGCTIMCRRDSLSPEVRNLSSGGIIITNNPSKGNARKIIKGILQLFWMELII